MLSTWSPTRKTGGWANSKTLTSTDTWRRGAADSGRSERSSRQITRGFGSPRTSGGWVAEIPGSVTKKRRSRPRRLFCSTGRDGGQPYLQKRDAAPVPPPWVRALRRGKVRRSLRPVLCMGRCWTPLHRQDPQVFPLQGGARNGRASVSSRRVPGQEGSPVPIRDSQVQELSEPAPLPGKRMPGEESGPAKCQSMEVALPPTQMARRKLAVAGHAPRYLGGRGRGGGSGGGLEPGLDGPSLSLAPFRVRFSFVLSFVFHLGCWGALL